MNLLPTRHTISNADKLYAGAVFHPGYAYRTGPADGRRGLEMAHVFVKDYGAIATLQAEGLIDSATSTELPNNETVTYTPATDGTSPLDDANNAAVATITVNGTDVLVYDLVTPRNITSTTTHGSSVVAMTILISGYDEYFEPMSELLTVPATGTSQAVVGQKAFRYVASIAIASGSDAEANTLDVGFGDAIGLPVRVDKTGFVMVFCDGALDAATKVVADTTSPATTTTNDVRGTWDSSTAPNGTREFVVWMFVEEHDDKVTTFGVTQA